MEEEKEEKDEKEEEREKRSHGRVNGAEKCGIKGPLKVCVQ